MSSYLVTGATGNVGREVVTAVLAGGNEARAVTRDPARAELPPGAIAVAGDLGDAPTLYDAVEGVDGIFLLPGYDGAADLLAHAKARGTTRVVLLSGGSAASGDTSNAVTAYMMASETVTRDSGLAWTLLRPTAFMSNTLRWRPKLSAGDVLRLPFAHVRTALVDPADIAAVAVRALVDGGHDGAVLYPSGPESLTLSEQVRVLGEGLGRPLRLDPQPDDEARAEMLESTPAAYVDAFFDFYVARTLDESVVTPDVRDVTGRAPATFADWVRRHAAEF